MNDIINFKIVNPWSHNLREMEKHLTKQSRLNIFKRSEKNKVIHLIGRTDIGTTYEIMLCPSIINNWIKWKTINQGILNEELVGTLKNIILTQKTIDDNYCLR